MIQKFRCMVGTTREDWVAPEGVMLPMLKNPKQTNK